MLRNSIDPQSFELQAGGVEAIESEEAARRREWNALQEQLRAATWNVRERLRQLREAGTTAEFEAAWATYEALLRYQAEFDEIRRLRAAAVIARDNARLLQAAACANLPEELSRAANAAIARILANAGETTTSVILEPHRPATLRGQLTVEAESPDEKVSTFLDRAGWMASRALGQLSLAALKAGEEEAASQTA